MEKQNNALRATLQKLRERHELETRYIGIQERMFSNLRNSTLPAHIIQQIKTTEDAVRNTHKLVLEQQEIQNTLSPNKYKQQVRKCCSIIAHVTHNAWLCVTSCGAEISLKRLKLYYKMWPR